MPSQFRRSLLRAAGLAMAGSLAGCAMTGQQSSPPPQLGSLDVLDFDPGAYTIHALLLDDESPVYWATERVIAADGNDVGGAVFEDYPKEPGEYVLHVRLDGTPRSTWEQFEFAEYDASCLGLSVHIGGEDVDAGSLSIWKTRNPRECE